MTLQMIKSVINGKDYEALNILITLHGPTIAPKILDCTWGKGSMWCGCDYQPVERSDIQALPGITKQISFDQLHTVYPAGEFDVVVFDPPHLPSAAASEHSNFHWRERYGFDHTVKGDNVSGCFASALASIKQVLTPGGIAIVKIADLIHNHVYQWQHIEVVLAAREVGLTPCDLLINCNPKASQLISSKWQKQNHLRKAHCYWVVLRNGGCEK